MDMRASFTRVSKRGGHEVRHLLTQGGSSQQMANKPLVPGHLKGFRFAVLIYEESMIFDCRPILYATNVNKSLAYYGDVLGFKIGWRWSNEKSCFLEERDELSGVGTALVGSRQGAVSPLRKWMRCMQNGYARFISTPFLRSALKLRPRTARLAVPV